MPYMTLYRLATVNKITQCQTNWKPVMRWTDCFESFHSFFLFIVHQLGELIFHWLIYFFKNINVMLSRRPDETRRDDKWLLFRNSSAFSFWFHFMVEREQISPARVQFLFELRIEYVFTTGTNILRMYVWISEGNWKKHNPNVLIGWTKLGNALQFILRLKNTPSHYKQCIIATDMKCSNK